MWLTIVGKEIKIIEARPVSESGEPGTILSVTKEGLSVGTKDGALLVTRVQPAGKPAMSASDWARGARVQRGDRCEKPMAAA